MNAPDDRRYDLDWLRVIAFGILIWFHAAIIFIPGGLPLIQNAETSEPLAWFVSVSHQFRLSLLFLVSGCGVAYARRKRGGMAFVRERSVRLLVPLVFGVFVIVPPMVYLEKLHVGTVDVSFWQFYPSFFSEGVYPDGHLSWHHFWFIAYLFLFCLIGMVWFDRLADLRNPVRRKISILAQGRGIYTMIVPLAVVEILLRAAFPGFRDLIHDWASFFHWFLIFLAGFVIAGDRDILDNIAARVWTSMLLALGSGVLLFSAFYDHGFHLDPADENVILKYVSLCIVRMTFVWSVLLTCAGLAGRYLRGGGTWLTYLNEAVYPCFILHLAVTVALGFYVVPTQFSVLTKYMVVTMGTVLLVLLIYQLLIRPFKPVRVLFGMKSK